jgi:hypothetical protein
VLLWQGLDQDSRPMLVAGCALTVLGPSFGEWYAGKRWTPGLSLRVVGGGLIAGGLASFAHNFGSGNDSGGALALVGVGLVGVGAFTSMVSASGDAVEYNQAHRIRWAVSPTVSHGAQGLAVVGTF